MKSIKFGRENHKSLNTRPLTEVVIWTALLPKMATKRKTGKIARKSIKFFRPKAVTNTGAL
jgi:hypothetical protein